MEAWREFATYGDAASAEVIVGLLRSEDIPARVISDQPMPGLTRGFCVMVPAGSSARCSLSSYCPA